MKLMKKLTALLLTLVMVLGMGSVVHASEATTVTGKITINNAIDGQTYSIYRILELESYTKGGNHAYKATASWKEFFKTGAGKDYLTIDESGVVTSSTNLTAEKAAAFAKAALAYAKDDTNTIRDDGTDTANGTTVTFDSLPLGYYLVDSSTGALCSLNTTAPEVKIQEKNGVPSVTKTVDNVNANTANIGQTVTFTTTITAKPGAENYVLHDKMTEGLTFDGTVTVKKGTDTLGEAEYTLKTTGFKDGCTFEIEFAQTFCNTLTAEATITVTYTAKLNEKAVIAEDGNTNTTWLNYGDNSETTKATTTTKTFALPVYKFTKGTTNTPAALPGVKFTLSENENGTDPIKLVKIADATDGDSNSADVYRHAKERETSTVTEVTTPTTGRFTIQGLKAGTYYLTETATVTGYNKLTAPVTVVIGEDGKVTVGGTETQTVEIENKTGSLLPSTGGRGTMAFYIVGALLVLGSGVVLITKKRMR